MTAGSGAELVQAALLGTDRRPPRDGEPEVDPASALLDRAVRWRALRQVRVGLDPVPRPDPRPPAPAAPLPPPAARDLLDEILLRPGHLAVNLWLQAASAAGVGLAPEHWTPVLDLAARQPALDRAALAAGLGERGRTFAGSNPAWRRVLTSFPAPGAPGAPGAGPPVGAADADVLPGADLENLRTDPDLLFAVADPWPEPTCRAALALLGSGTLPLRAATAYGAAVGARLPLARAALVAQAAERFLGAEQPPRYPWSPPSSGRAGLVAVDDVLATRRLLAAAFDPDRPPPAHLPDPSR